MSKAKEVICDFVLFGPFWSTLVAICQELYSNPFICPQAPNLKITSDHVHQDGFPPSLPASRAGK